MDSPKESPTLEQPSDSATDVQAVPAAADELNGAELDAVSGGAARFDSSMVQLQDMVSKRSQLDNLAKTMANAMSDSAKKIVGNIR